MCRSIRQLRRLPDAGPATTGEAAAAALQYVRKVSGMRAPSARHQAAFEAAVLEIAAATERFLAQTGTLVVVGPDPMADPATRRALLAARPARSAHRRSATASASAAAAGPAPEPDA